MNEAPKQPPFPMAGIPKPTVKQMWADYMAHAMPAEAGDHQISESKLCFMGGANAMFHLLAIRAAELPDEEAAEYLSDLHKEIRTFAEDYLRTGQVP